MISGVLKGAGAGVAGAAVMTAVEKAEQALTGRPSSFVPGRTLAHLLGIHDVRDDIGAPIGWDLGLLALGALLTLTGWAMVRSGRDATESR